MKPVDPASLAVCLLSMFVLIVLMLWVLVEHKKEIYTLKEEVRRLADKVK